MIFYKWIRSISKIKLSKHLKYITYKYQITFKKNMLENFSFRSLKIRKTFFR